MGFLDKIIGEEITKGPHRNDETEKENKKEKGVKRAKGSSPNYLIPIAVIIGVLVIVGGGYFGYIQLKQSPKDDPKITALEQQIAELEKQSAQSEDIESLRDEVAALRAKTTRLTLTNAEIINKVRPAVVYIETTEGAGSGMIIESSGYILTNAHVVENTNVVDITTSDKKTYIASVVGRDEVLDLAILKINGSAFPTVELGNSSENILKQGDPVFSVGYSYGFDEDISFKDGIVSRRLPGTSGITYLEITAEIQPGNSGGPLVDKLGRVVGINTFTYGKTGDPLKFAIPINTAKDYIPKLKAGENITSPKAVSTLPRLTVSLSSYTQPSGTVTRGGSMADFAKYNFCASSQVVVIGGISISRQGLYQDSDIFSIALDFQDGQPPFASFIDSSTHKASGFPSNWAWVIPANSCKSLIVKAIISKNAVVGRPVQLSIASANDIISNVAVYGDFPIKGNTMTIGY